MIGDTVVRWSQQEFSFRLWCVRSMPKNERGKKNKLNGCNVFVYEIDFENQKKIKIKGRKRVETRNGTKRRCC
jgi:hypothetical protein